MARTYRRTKPRSQNKTLRCEKNLVQSKKDLDIDGYGTPYVNIKNDKRFFTDNQDTPKWRSDEKRMNRRVRYESKKKLKKIKSMEQAEEFLLLRKEKQEIHWETCRV